jgi:hypothetical protein
VPVELRRPTGLRHWWPYLAGVRRTNPARQDPPDVTAPGPVTALTATLYSRTDRTRRVRERVTPLCGGRGHGTRGPRDP